MNVKIWTLTPEDQRVVCEQQQTADMLFNNMILEDAQNDRKLK